MTTAWRWRIVTGAVGGPGLEGPDRARPGLRPGRLARLRRRCQGRCVRPGLIRRPGPGQRGPARQRGRAGQLSVATGRAGRGSPVATCRSASLNRTDRQPSEAGETDDDDRFRQPHQRPGQAGAVRRQVPRGAPRHRAHRGGLRRHRGRRAGTPPRRSRPARRCPCRRWTRTRSPSRRSRRPAGRLETGRSPWWTIRCCAGC